MRPASIAFLVVVAASLVGCNRAKSTCEHYQHKSFKPIPQRAMEACTTLCQRDADVDACESVSGWHRENGDLDRSRDFAQKACELGENPQTCAQKRESAKKSHDRRSEYNEAMDAERARLRACVKDPGPCERGCERGAISECIQLADMHKLGLGRTADPQRAHELYAKVCELHDDSQYCWSNVYVNSGSCAVPDNRPPCDEELEGSCPSRPEPKPGCEEVRVDSKRTAAQLLKVCNGQRACDEILERSCRLDIAFCERACDENDDGAHCRQLAIMHETGDGVPERNPAKAARFARRACELGDTHSCDGYAADKRKLKPKPFEAAGAAPKP